MVRWKLNPGEGCGSMIVGNIACLSVFGEPCLEVAEGRCMAEESIERMGVAIQWRGAKECRVREGFVDVKKLPSGEYVWKHRHQEWAE